MGLRSSGKYISGSLQRFRSNCVELLGFVTPACVGKAVPEFGEGPWQGTQYEPHGRLPVKT